MTRELFEPGLVHGQAEDSGATITPLSSIGLWEARLLADLVGRYLESLRPERAVFSLHKVRYLESSGIGLLLGLEQRFRPLTRFVLTGLSPSVRRVVRAANLSSVFTIDDAGQEAVALAPDEPVPELALAGRYHLTEAGRAYCQRHLPEFTGSVLPARRRSRAVFTSLLERGYLRWAEFRLPSLAQERPAVLALVATVFRQVNRNLVLEGLAEAAGPSAPLEPPQALELAERAPEVAAFQHSVFRQAGKQASGLASEQVLQAVPARFWFEVLHEEVPARRRAALDRVAEVLGRYAARLDLTDVVAVVVTELAQQAERAVLQAEAAGHPELLQSPAFRSQALARRAAEGRSVALLIHPGPSLSFEVHNEGLEGLEERRAQDSDYGLPNLQSRCLDLGIALHSWVAADENQVNTVASLTLTL